MRYVCAGCGAEYIYSKTDLYDSTGDPTLQCLICEVSYCHECYNDHSCMKEKS